jgi:E3 ubiquitin-protein ligase listerin
VVLDPASVHAYLNPVSVAPSQPPTPQPQRGQQKRGPQALGRPVQRSGTMTPVEGTRSKSEADEEKPQDRNARLRIGGLGALGWVIGKSSVTDIGSDTLMGICCRQQVEGYR